MYKEFIIILVVVFLVVGLDIITNRYTKETLEILSNELYVLRKYILDEEKERSEAQMKNIKQNGKKNIKF